MDSIVEAQSGSSTYKRKRITLYRVPELMSSRQVWRGDTLACWGGDGGTQFRRLDRNSGTSTPYSIIPLRRQEDPSKLFGFIQNNIKNPYRQFQNHENIFNFYVICFYIMYKCTLKRKERLRKTKLHEANIDIFNREGGYKQKRR